MPELVIKISPPISNESLNTLFAAVWQNHQTTDFQPILRRSLLYLCGYMADELVAYVNLAWDGGIHAFLLDTTVHPNVQRQGIGLKIVQAAISAARERGIAWIHVDYEPHLHTFYMQCGFSQTMAGLINLDDDR
jgi:GNAT superfamily N-acetyltransferase